MPVIFPDGGGFRRTGTRKGSLPQRTPRWLGCGKPCSATLTKHDGGPLRQLERSAGRDVQYGAALALAYARDDGRAQTLTDDLGKRFPEDTFVRFNYLPTLRAKLALNRGNPSEAIESLEGRARYELGQTTGSKVRVDRLVPRFCARRSLSGRRIRAAKPSLSSRKSSTIAGLWSTNPSVHWHISKSAEPMRCKATPPKPRQRIRISSPSGKTPTLTFPSSSPRNPNTRS